MNVRKFLVAAILCFSHLSLAELTGPYGGQIVKKNGKEYEITRNNEEVRVYLSKMVTPKPSTLIVVLKKDKKIIDRVKVKLDLKAGEPGSYTGIVPANILVSGGLTFDIE